MTWLTSGNGYVNRVGPLMMHSREIETASETTPVRLYKEREAAWFSDALLQCSSLRLADVSEYYYAPGSVVPAEPWTSCGEQGFDLRHTLNAHDFDRRSVMHFCVDPILSRHISEEIGRVSHLSLPKASKEEVTLRLRDDVVAWSMKEFQIGSNPQVFHVGFNAPGFLTGTIDQGAGKLIGIHIDSWDGTTIQSRKSCRYRLTVNLGPGVRWLLFAPDSLEEFVTRIGLICDDEEFVLPASVLLSRGAITNVRALRLLPGEGYLAPTDAIYHDVSTAWTDRGSLNVQMLFNPPS